MFYCDKCAEKHKYPVTFSKSVGLCECCGERTLCNDRPSSFLPTPKKDEKPKAILTTNNEKILDLMYTSIMSEGGDGDAIWLSKHTSLYDLIPLMDEYNNSNNTNWYIKKLNNHILWGADQEWAIITDDETFFNSQPNYIVLRINY